MAVPGRGNGLMEEDEIEDGFLEVEGEVEEESDIPPHLRPLAEAAQRGDADALRIALDDYNGSINDPIEDGDTALHLCCLYGYLSCVRLLLEKGASIESRDEEGAIPLHDACAGGFIEIVKLIIEYARDPDFVKRMLDTTDVEGDTPLHHAARGEHLDVVQLLLSLGASPKTTNLFGKTPAELADADTQVRRFLETVVATSSVNGQ
ncbi:ankyrin repeat and SOCS box protein 13-like [Iris pallida]|uniref:Ankyrin repeat and SOCS box protein 13-like n=1 Tax=Iris pallida TaxID=29817 RepID=A0AAX6HS67_IRIPA|nr:ankyrin repeat and SOCS box protein 13-like [Iris pallida]KAJ6843115.1 ankyrin repeat and SOCS box protein 13-like [Iris pallida]